MPREHVAALEARVGQLQGGLAAAGGTAAALFSTGIDSPVSALWLTKKSFVTIRRRSAGTSAAGVQHDDVPRHDLRQRDLLLLPVPHARSTVVRTMAWSFSTARPDRSSWMEERPTLMSTIPPTTMVERRSPMTKDTPAMTRSWMTRGLANRW